MISPAAGAAITTFGPTSQGIAALTRSAPAGNTRYMSSHREPAAADPATAPLAYPAITAACVLLAVGVVELPRLPLRADDYGSTLVYTAFALYSILTVLLMRWGWQSRPAVLGNHGPRSASTSRQGRTHVNV